MDEVFEIKILPEFFLLYAKLYHRVCFSFYLQSFIWHRIKNYWYHTIMNLFFLLTIPLYTLLFHTTKITKIWKMHFDANKQTVCTNIILYGDFRKTTRELIQLSVSLFVCLLWERIFLSGEIQRVIYIFKNDTTRYLNIQTPFFAFLCFLILNINLHLSDFWLEKYIPHLRERDSGINLSKDNILNERKTNSF